MLRGLLSILSLIIIIPSLIVMIPTVILPGTFLYQVVPIFAPLHQAIACTAGETIQYELEYSAEYNETHFLCVDAAGRERNVDDVLLRPGNIASLTCFIGVLLMFVPLFFTVRAGWRGEHGAEMQNAMQEALAASQRAIAEMSQGSTTSTTMGASASDEGEAVE